MIFPAVPQRKVQRFSVWAKILLFGSFLRTSYHIRWGRPSCRFVKVVVRYHQISVRPSEQESAADRAKGK